MKKWIIILPVFILAVVLLGTGAYASEISDASTSVDYGTLMIQAAAVGDYSTGYAAQDARNAKIEDNGYEYSQVNFDDLELLAKIIYAEAGSNWLSDEWKMCVGEVVLNRVASPEFPDTIAAVLAQPGQYYGANRSYFKRLVPNERCVECAWRLLNGERLMESSVVYQANFRQGGGVCKVFRDGSLGSTYFCYSTNKSLYTDAA